MNARFVNKSIPSSLASAMAESQVPVTLVASKGRKKHQVGFSNTQVFKGTYRTPFKF
jgi:hypothetical protein